MFGKVALKRAAMATLGAVRPRRDRHAEAQGEQAGAAWTIVDEHPASDDFGAAGRRQPAARSKRARRALMALLVFLAVAASVAAASSVPWVLYLLYTGILLVLGGIAFVTLLWMLDAWRTPASLSQGGLASNDLEPAHSFSLIVAARHEEGVLETTLSRLVTSDHPAFEVLVVVGTDDPLTLEVAERAAEHHPERIKVVLDASSPKSKPKALNAALPYCTGTITGVFDAEDDVHPALLRRIDQRFQSTDADVVQAGVQLMNFRSSWLTVRNVLEYYFWFRSRLHFHARWGFIPLGGNTVFIRTQVLKAVSGWDPECLAEDCELGVRLSVFGAHTVVAYEPELVTREECPPTLGQFTRQRTRWNQGYLQTLSRGYWRRLPLRQRALAAYTLTMPYAMAVAWLLLPIAITTAFLVGMPVAVTMIAFLPLLPMLAMLAVEVAGLGDFSRTYGERPSPRDYARLVLGLPLYQAVLTFAAARAVAREARGERGWDKTTHLGLHLAENGGEQGERPNATLGVASRPGKPSPRDGARARAPEPTTGVGALDQSPINSDDTSAANGAALTGCSVVASSNGHRESAHRPDEELFAAMGHEPLWVRLDAVSARGSTSLPAPRSVRSAALTPHADPVTDSRSLEPSAAACALSQSLLHRNGASEANGASLTGGSVVVSSNGHHESAHRSDAGLLTAVSGEPPSVRLDAVSANGSISLPLPRSARLPGEVGRQLRLVRALLWRALASHAYLVPMVAVIAGVGIVQATNMQHWPGELFDEGTYVSNAWALKHGALANYTYSYGHPPLAWLLIALWASTRGIFGTASYSIDTGRELMFAVNIVSCWLLFVLARRLTMGRAAAAGAVILFALSPLSLYYHRAVLLDNVAIAWALAAFALALTPRRRLWAFAGSGACFALSVLSKETALILLPVLLLAATQAADKRTRRYCLTLFVAFLALIALAYPLYATLKGELIPGSGHVSLIGSIVYQLFSREGSGGLLDPHSGAHATVTAWLWHDPWLLAAALALSPIALVRRGTRVAALAFLIQAGMMLRPGYLPDMYVIGLLPFAALIVAGGTEAVWRIWSRALKGLLTRTFGAAALALALAIPALIVGSRWARGDEIAMTVRADVPAKAAKRWLIEHVGHDKRLIVDDVFWIYLVEHGFDAHPMSGGFFSRTVVSFWPLDYDPAVKRHFPDGWRDFDYIVSTDGMRASGPRTPSAVQAINHSQVVARFADGSAVIEIRAISRALLSSPAASTLNARVAPSATGGRPYKYSRKRCANKEYLYKHVYAGGHIVCSPG